MCDSQVWILAYRDNRYDGLMLSRIESKWTLGPVQEWWLRYDKLQAKIMEVVSARAPGYRETYIRLGEEKTRLQEAFPICTP